jgi:hypothetical protein
VTEDTYGIYKAFVAPDFMDFLVKVEETAASQLINSNSTI